MPAKKKTDDKSLKELALLGGTSEASKIARCLLRYPEQALWGGYVHCPPGSLLDVTVKEFDQKTHAPLELPLFITLTLLSAVLLQRRVKLRIAGVKKVQEVFLWVMLLAQSGSLKSLTLSSITDTIAEAGEKVHLWELSSVSGPAAFMQEFAGTGEQASKNHCLCIIEEAGQFRKKMRDGAPLEELKMCSSKFMTAAKWGAPPRPENWRWIIRPSAFSAFLLRKFFFRKCGLKIC